MRGAPRIWVVVGGPGSGKDELVQGIHAMGSRYATVVPKHTNRARNEDDGSEMICKGDPGWDLAGCDIVYELHGNKYGIKSHQVWMGLRRGVNQVVVVGEADAINKMRSVWGPLLCLIYIHSNRKPAEYAEEAGKSATRAYVQRRKKDYHLAFSFFLRNYAAFDHVLIFSEALEDLYDQMFRLFRRYRSG